MSYDDLARNLDTYGDGEESPREPDPRDEAFALVLEAHATRAVLPWLKRYPTYGYFYLDLLIDVADGASTVEDVREALDDDREDYGGPYWRTLELERYENDLLDKTANDGLTAQETADLKALQAELERRASCT